MAKKEKKMRLTKENREKLLEKNEGFKTSTYFKGRNFSESRRYEIKDKKLHITSSGKGAWGGSRYSNEERIADDKETHRFLYEYLSKLKKD